MTEEKISILVAVYNSGEYLKKCLNSLVNQTHKNLEIICVDDGSTDNSPAILEEYAKKDARIKIITKPNGGLSSSRNAGISEISGEYFMFMDADDWLSLKACEEMYAAAKTHNADCVMCAYVKEFGNHSAPAFAFDKEKIVFEKQEVANNIHRRLFGPLGAELRHPENGDILVSAWAQLFKTSKCRENTFFDNKIIGTFEDGLYQIDVYTNCDKYVYLKKPFYHYRKTNSSAITVTYKPQFFEQWTCLFDILEQKAKKINKPEYFEALNNRICISMIGLGLNQIRSKKGIFYNAGKLKQILKTPRYENAFKALKLKEFPIHWKLFFLLCKTKCTCLFVILLFLVEWARKNI